MQTRNFIFSLFKLFVFVIFAIPLSVKTIGAHCQIPCGIYDDHMRIHQIAEDITTIEKSMKQIKKLGRETPVDFNQIVRWVTNKENHAHKIQTVVAEYFMAQRIKPDTKQYSQKISTLHQMLLAAMKSKQTTDLSHVAELKTLLAAFEKLYFDK